MQTKQDGRLGTEKIGKHLRLCRIRKWRRCSSCRHRTRTEKPGPRRKNSWKLHFPAALFLRVSDGVFLFLSDTASVPLWCKQQHNPIRFHVYFHLSCRNRICRAGCRIEYFYQLSGTRTHGHVLRSHWRCYQHWS